MQCIITGMEMSHFHWGNPSVSPMNCKAELSRGWCGAAWVFVMVIDTKPRIRGCCSSWLCRAPLQNFCCCRLLVLVASWCCNCSWLMPGSGKTKLQKQQHNILLNTHWKWQLPTSLAPSALPSTSSTAPTPPSAPLIPTLARSFLTTFFPLALSRSISPSRRCCMLHIGKLSPEKWEETCPSRGPMELCSRSSTFQGFLFWPKSPKKQKLKPHTHFTEWILPKTRYVWKETLDERVLLVKFNIVIRNPAR